MDDEEKKKEMRAKVAADAAPKHFGNLARLLEARGGDYFAGHEVSLPQFTFHRFRTL